MASGLPTRLTAPHQKIQGLAPWRKVFGPSLEDPDGSVENPYTIAGFTDTLYKEIHQPGGRIFCTGQQEGELQLWPLFTEDAGVVTIQPWGFDQFNKLAFEFDHEADNGYILAPEDSNPGICLGLPYNLLWDTPSSPETQDITSLGTGRIAVSFSKECEPYPNEFGDEYSAGPKVRFDTQGFAHFFVNVTNITVGSVVILARVV